MINSRKTMYFEIQAYTFKQRTVKKLFSPILLPHRFFLLRSPLDTRSHVAQNSFKLDMQLRMTPSRLSKIISMYHRAYLLLVLKLLISHEWFVSATPALRKPRQENHKFEVSLGYVASFSPTDEPVENTAQVPGNNQVFEALQGCVNLESTAQ